MRDCKRNLDKDELVEYLYWMALSGWELNCNEWLSEWRTKKTRGFIERIESVRNLWRDGCLYIRKHYNNEERKIKGRWKCLGAQRRSLKHDWQKRASFGGHMLSRYTSITVSIFIFNYVMCRNTWYRLLSFIIKCTQSISQRSRVESGNQMECFEVSVTSVLEFTVCQKIWQNSINTLDCQYFGNLQWYWKPHI